MIRFDAANCRLDQSCLIEASAGTGKTYAIASLYLRLVTEHGLLPENILVVTFTEAATKELRDRIRQRLRLGRIYFAGGSDGDELLEGIGARVGHRTALASIDKALQQFDTAAIFTIHGFCSSVLNEYRFETGSLFDSGRPADGKVLLERVMDDYWRRLFFGGGAQLLEPVMRRRLSPERLVKLLDRKVQNRFTEIIPQVDAAGLEQLDSQVSALFADISSLWIRERERFEELFHKAPELTRNEKSYKAELLPRLLDGMDSYIAAANPYALFDDFHKLTSRTVAKETKKKFIPIAEPLFDFCDALFDAVSQRVTLVVTAAAGFAREQLPLLKNRLSVRSYDDLLNDLLDALEGAHGRHLAELLQGKFRAALIDEFQDTDQTQYRIFRKIFAAGDLALFLIGDPKQSIYGFRGADLFAYMEARQGIRPENRFDMGSNWRSSEQMVQAVNHLFSQRTETPFIHDDLTYTQVAAAGKAGVIELGKYDPAALQFWFFSRDEGQKQINKGDGSKMLAGLVAAEISSLLAAAADGRAAIDGRPLAPEDIAVIVRSHNQADLVKAELDALAIPSVTNSNKSVFASNEALELALVLSAIANPSKEPQLKGALTTSIFGLKAADLYRIANDESELDGLLAAFAEYRETWQSKGFMVMMRQLMQRERLFERFLSLPSGERRLTNLQQAAEIIHGRESAGHSGIQRLVTWFCSQVAGKPDDEEYQLRLESDDSAVRIVTVHLSKGLEFPVVFVPFAWGGARQEKELAVCHRDGRQVADFGSPAFTENSRLALVESLSEELRLLYVALTRAKYRCYLAWGRFKGFELSPLAWLLHGKGLTDGNILEELQSAMAAISDEQLIEDLRSFAGSSVGAASVIIDPQPEAVPFTAGAQADQMLTCRVFDTAIDRRWRVASFSSLITGHKQSPELPDRDSGDGHSEEPRFQPGEKSIFSFPRGADAGSLLHGIFEELDFTRVDIGYYSELARSHFEKAAVDTEWLPAVTGMMEKVMTVPLGSDRIRLCDIGQESRRSELEFMFPMKLVESAGAASVLGSSAAGIPSIKALAGMLNFREQEGVLLGFIDLVFRHEGRYYIVDWKSNHLGDSAADYSSQRMQTEMTRHLYPLQYLLYTVALHRYLQLRLPSYSYAEHFGGVYYLFIRGMDPAFPESGVYFDRPEESLVASLEQYFAVKGEGGAHG